MNKNSNMSIFLKGLLLENPVFVLILGTCPTLATTKTVIGAIGMLKYSYISFKKSNSRQRAYSLLHCSNCKLCNNSGNDYPRFRALNL